MHILLGVVILCHVPGQLWSQFMSTSIICFVSATNGSPTSTSCIPRGGWTCKHYINCIFLDEDKEIFSHSSFLCFTIDSYRNTSVQFPTILHRTRLAVFAPLLWVWTTEFPITCQTCCGTVLAVVLVMDAVLKLECHGSIENYQWVWMMTLKCVFVKVVTTMMKILLLKR